MKLLPTLLSVMAMLIGAASVHAQTTTTETLTFDNNQLPSGWNFVVSGPGNNVQIVNQRLEVGQVDTYAGISKSIDSTGATQIKIEYDSNIANVGSGQGSAAILARDPTNWRAEYIYSSMNKYGWGQDSMLFNSLAKLAGSPDVGLYSNVVSPAVFGNYHMSAVFENGQISQTVTNLDTGATFSSGVIAAPGFVLSNMHGVVLWGDTTTGSSAWIDNATITVTAVPEPETYAMFLAGLGLVGAIARRRQSDKSSVV